MAFSEIKKIDTLIQIINQTQNHVKSFISENSEDICHEHTREYLEQILFHARELSRALGFPLESVLHQNCIEEIKSELSVFSKDLVSYEERQLESDPVIGDLIANVHAAPGDENVSSLGKESTSPSLAESGAVTNEEPHGRVSTGFPGWWGIKC